MTLKKIELICFFFSKIVCKINSVNMVARKQKWLICDFVYTAYTLILLMLLKLLTLLTLLTLFTLLTQQYTTYTTYTAQGRLFVPSNIPLAFTGFQSTVQQDKLSANEGRLYLYSCHVFYIGTAQHTKAPKSCLANSL